jgi:hypothetical protein
MMFSKSISNKLPLSLAIVADERLFVPSGVAKKCIDVGSDHTPQHLLVRKPQMSLAGL